ncbi:hypothetical protein [uncultured Thiodictyon sp.]|uniref:hypothetical protein n=1 Tax=uncultured Thiodictyon sp. TaxID=1846217 RepID=UPI0025FF7A33|nr:hypothetical protein [uncultured Thiodictyon sp.]
MGCERIHGATITSTTTTTTTTTTTMAIRLVVLILCRDLTPGIHPHAQTRDTPARRGRHH